MTRDENTMMSEHEYEQWQRGDTIKIGDYTIKAKRDFGKTGHLIDGKMVMAGWGVTKNGMLETPGGLWDTTLRGAQRTVGMLMAAQGNTEVFHGLRLAFINN